jgi:alpha-tubulin suppressor-like RCC1 family protein
MLDCDWSSDVCSSDLLRWWEPLAYPDVDELTTEGSWVQASAGNGVCALDDLGQITCWIRSETEGDFGGVAQPTEAMVSICATGYFNGCGLDSEGMASCWGELEYITDNTPTDVAFTTLSCGYAHVCGLTAEGEIRCWGYDEYGETTPPS